MSHQEIPGTTYNGPDEEPETITITGDVGEAILHVVGNNFGEYTLDALVYDVQNPRYQSVTANTALGQVDTYVVQSVNGPPSANAGRHQTVRKGSVVTLHGSGALGSPGALSLTFEWTQAGGVGVTLRGADTATPTFTPRASGIYSFSLVVSDGVDDSLSEVVNITVPILGDIDVDGDVDTNDTNLITAARNKPASGPNDLRDLDADGMITALDARKAVLLCTRPRCATQ